MGNTELHDRLLDETRRYDPALHTRSLLAPFGDVILLQRAKWMSYEQIAATLTRHGLRISPAAVGCFCRRNFTKAQIARLRQQFGSRPAKPAHAADVKTAPFQASSVSRESGRRGPKIARDDF